MSNQEAKGQQGAFGTTTTEGGGCTEQVGRGSAETAPPVTSGKRPSKRQSQRKRGGESCADRFTTSARSGRRRDYARGSTTNAVCSPREGHGEKASSSVAMGARRAQHRRQEQRRTG